MRSVKNFQTNHIQLIFIIRKNSLLIKFPLSSKLNVNVLTLYAKIRTEFHLLGSSATEALDIATGMHGSCADHLKLVPSYKSNVPKFEATATINLASGSDKK